MIQIEPPMVVAGALLLVSVFSHFLFPARRRCLSACVQPFRVEGKTVCRLGGAEGGGADHSATYPLMINFPDSQYLFNLIFFLVIGSVLLQGKRFLGLPPVWIFIGNEKNALPQGQSAKLSAGS